MEIAAYAKEPKLAAERKPSVFSIIRKWTSYEKAQAFSYRPKGIAGSRIDDLSSLKKCICLCDTCIRRFDYQKHGYQRHDIAGRHHAIGQCDGCNERGAQCNVLLARQS